MTSKGESMVTADLGNEEQGQTLVKKKSGNYSPFAAYSYTVNYILGVGILSVPYAFSKAGIGLSLVFLVVVTFVSAWSMIWLVESQARSCAFRELKDVRGELLGKDKQMTPIRNGKGDVSEGFVYDPQMKQVDEESAPLGSESIAVVEIKTPEEVPSNLPSFRIKGEKLEINEICGRFLGPGGRLFYEIAVVCFIFGALTGYATVVTSSLLAYVPIPGLTDIKECDVYDKEGKWGANCETGFGIYLALFGSAVLYIALKGLREQVVFQVAMTLLRFLAVIIMVVTILVAMWRQPYEPTESGGSAPYTRDMPFFDMTGFHFIFSVSVYAQLCHHSAPGIIEPLKDKTKAKGVFLCAFLTTATIYASMGIMCSLYFGDKVPPMVTLLWTHYDAEETGQRPFWAIALSYIVVMFPVFDVLSAYPLNAITLGNNLYARFKMYRPFKSLTDKRGRAVFRVPAVVGPVVLAYTVRDLSSIIGIVGLFGFVLIFHAPGLLQIFSRFRARRQWSDKRAGWTPYSWVFSHEGWVYSTLVIGTAALFFAMYLKFVKKEESLE